MAGPGRQAPDAIAEPVSLVDVAPTALTRLGLPRVDTDGMDLFMRRPERRAGKAIYAESFAPLRSTSAGARCAASGATAGSTSPRRGPSCSDDRAGSRRSDGPREAKSRRARPSWMDPSRASRARISARSSDALDPEAERTTARARIRRRGRSWRGRQPASSRADPEGSTRARRAPGARDLGRARWRRAATRARGDPAKDDESNPQAQMRLAFALVEARDCAGAEPHFKRAMALDLPSADPYLGLAGCQAATRRSQAARSRRSKRLRRRKDNPVVLANLGQPSSELGDAHGRDVGALASRFTLDLDFHRRDSISRSRTRRPAAATTPRAKRKRSSSVCRRTRRSAARSNDSPGRSSRAPSSVNRRHPTQVAVRPRNPAGCPLESKNWINAATGTNCTGLDH